MIPVFINQPDPTPVIPVNRMFRKCDFLAGGRHPYIVKVASCCIDNFALRILKLNFSVGSTHDGEGLAVCAIVGRYNLLGLGARCTSWHLSLRHGSVREPGLLNTVDGDFHVSGGREGEKTRARKIDSGRLRKLRPDRVDLQWVIIPLRAVDDGLSVLCKPRVRRETLLVSQACKFWLYLHGGAD